MKSYPVRHPIRHNGKCYAAGDIITLDERTARPLRAARAIGDGVGKAAPANADTDGKTDTAEGAGTGTDAGTAGTGDRHSALVAAARSLDPNTAELWTNGGAPQIAALEAASGLKGVTAAERDAAWAEVG